MFVRTGKTVPVFEAGKWSKMKLRVRQGPDYAQWHSSLYVSSWLGHGVRMSGQTLFWMFFMRLTFK